MLLQILKQMFTNKVMKIWYAQCSTELNKYCIAFLFNFCQFNIDFIETSDSVISFKYSNAL